MPENQEIISKLYGYVKNNELITPLSKLHTIFSLVNSELVNDVILISARIKKLESDIRRGVLNIDQENLQHGRILNSVLSLVREIEEDQEILKKYRDLNNRLEKNLKQENKPTSAKKDALLQRLSFVKEKKIKVNVLWVDDHPTNNSSEIETLDKAGLVFDLANSSQQAYDLINQNNYHLMLSDVERDGNKNEGLEFHKKLISQRIDIPTIFYTSFVDRSKGVPPYAFGIAWLPHNLIHLVSDVIERIE